MIEKEIARIITAGVASPLNPEKYVSSWDMAKQILDLTKTRVCRRCDGHGVIVPLYSPPEKMPCPNGCDKGQETKTLRTIWEAW